MQLSAEKILDSDGWYSPNKKDYQVLLKKKFTNTVHMIAFNMIKMTMVSVSLILPDYLTELCSREKFGNAVLADI